MMLRTVFSIVAGLTAVLFLFLLGNGVLMLANGELTDHLAAGILPAPEWVLLDMLVRVMSAVAGGYLAAAIAPRAALRHAVMVGTIATLIGTIDVAIGATSLPLWYNLLAIAVILPATAMGGGIGAGRSRIAGGVNGGEPRTA